MAWEENSCISLHMQLIAILSRIGVKVALLQPIDACLALSFIAHFASQQYNQLCISMMSLHAQNSKISHQGFLSALNEEY